VYGAVSLAGKATAVIGARPAGKTTFLHQFRRERLEGGVSRECLPSVRTKDGYEVDFIARRPGEKPVLIQVCAELDDRATRERELRALQSAAAEHPRASPHVVTLTPESAAGALEGAQVHHAGAWLLGER